MQHDINDKCDMETIINILTTLKLYHNINEVPPQISFPMYKPTHV